MKNLILILSIVSLSQVALAKKGGSDPAKLAYKNSQAGFVSESLENSLRQLTSVNTQMSDMVEDASVVSKTLNDSVVTISLNDGSAISFTCQRIDDLSNGGTVVKKDVICVQQ